MRIKITKPDGTLIEAEGSAEECARLAGEREAKPLFVNAPPSTVIIPIPYEAPTTTPRYPEWIGPTWTGSTINVTGGGPS